MWSCPRCHREFNKVGQSHSCKTKMLDEHFKNKELAQELFSALIEAARAKVGACTIISLPCCVHLLGTYDFLAALPRKDRLEIRFALRRRLESSRVIQSVQLSKQSFKVCINLRSPDQIDDELISWMRESYCLKDQL